MHPSEAVHGDLGRIGSDDCVLVLSKSGETDEITRLLPILRHTQTPVVAITCKPQSTLAGKASVVLDLGNLKEACSLGLAPSTSTTVMMALGDALALVTSCARGFSAEDFASRHPGGSLGLQLANVEEAMRPIDQCRVAAESKTVRTVFVEAGRPGRRTGAIILVGQQGTVQGIFTDSDLARLFESKRDDFLDVPIREVMSSSPITVRRGVKISEAKRLMTDLRISELPVVDEQDRPIGLIDITDLIALRDEPSATADVPNAADGQPATLPFEQRQRAS